MEMSKNNNKKLNIEYKIYQFITETPNDFFQWCLENKLYKVSEDKNFNSRMKKYYNGEIIFNGLTTVVAYTNDKPVGIVLCEHQNHYQKAIRLKNEFSSKPTIGVEYDWGFHQLGMVSFFVKNTYRELGIATQLWERLENIRLKDFIKQNPNELSVPLFQAKELAFNIVEKKSKYAYVCELNKENFNYPWKIHNLTNGIFELRSDDPAPIVKLTKKQPFKNYQDEYQVEEFIVKPKESQKTKIKF